MKPALTLEFKKPSVVSNLREEAEPFLKQCTEYFKNFKPPFSENAFATYVAAKDVLTTIVELALMDGTTFTNTDSTLCEVGVESLERGDRFFRAGSGFWHTDGTSHTTIKMTASSSTPLTAACGIGFSQELVDEAELLKYTYLSSNPEELKQENFLVFTLFEAIADRISLYRTKSFGWLEAVATNKTEDTPFSVLDGLVVVEDLEFFKPEPFDVIQGNVKELLHASQPRKPKEPTLRVFGRNLCELLAA